MTLPANNTSGGSSNLGLLNWSVPLVDKETGLISRVWWSFFQNLYGRVGGASSPSITQITNQISNNFAVIPPPEYDNVSDENFPAPGIQGPQGIKGIQGIPGASTVDDTDVGLEILSYIRTDTNPTFNTAKILKAFTPNSLAGITGTVTNDDANAGSVGEFPAPTDLAGVSLVTSTAKNMSSYVLGPGDWEIDGTVVFVQAATTTATTFAVGLSTTSNTFLGFGTYNQITAAFPAAATQVMNAPTMRIKVAASTTTTVYLIGYMTFATSTVTASGYLHIRRVR